MSQFRNRPDEIFERYRLRLASRQVEGFLAVMGLVSGVATGTIIVEDDVERPLLLQASELARYCESEPEADIDLVAIPAERSELASIYLEANLYEAREALITQGADALYVPSPLEPMNFRTFGVARRKDVEAAYEFRA